MLKKLLTIGLGLLLWTGARGQATINENDVQFWVGSGPNSTLVCIGWDDASASYTPTVVVWGVHWNGSIHLIDALDSIATYDERFTYDLGASGFLNSVSYSDPDAGLELTPSGYNCNNYGAGYGSGTLGSTWLRISTSTCSNYTFTGITNVVYASDPDAVFSCPKAQAVSVASITENGATVTIVDTANVDNYTVMLYAGDVLVDSAVVYNHTVVYNTLSANTGYTVKVFSNCPDGMQTGARTASFRTPCVTIAHASLPWSEDFQSYDGLSYSSSSVSFASQVFCWDLKNAYNASDPYINSSTSVNAAGGKCLYVSSRVSNPTILVLPPFEDGPEALQLSFDVLSTYRHGFEVGVMADVAVDSTFTPVATCLPDGEGWTHFDVSFAGFAEGRLALRSNDNGPAYLDNVTVGELPRCVRPSQVLVSNVTSSSAELTIVDPNTSNHYMLYAAGDSVEIYGNSYTLSDLQPNMRYEVGVRTLCADTTTGVTETAFRTACGIVAIPYHENFNQFVDVSNGFGYAVADSTLPCWGFLKGRSLDRLEVFPRSQSVTYGYGEEGYTMRIYGNYSDSRDVVVLPEFDQEISNLEISFVARPSENGNFGGMLQVGYVTNAADSSSFVSVADYASSQFANGFDFCTGIFADAPAGSRIALRYLPSGGSAKSWYVDEIDVHAMPACVRAQGISVDNNTTEGFTLHVADPTSVNHYRYYVAAGGDVVDSADFYDSVFVVTGLMASTDYELQVVSVCGDGTLTLPRTMSVATLCAPVAQLPFEEGFEGWTATQLQGMNRCWNRLYMNSSSNLVTNNYPYCATGSANAYEGFKSLKMYSKGTSNGIKEYSVVYLPAFEENVSSLKVGFNYKYGGTTYNINKVKVAVGISDSVGDTATFTRLATLVPTVVGWNEMEVELSGYTGTGRRIAIMQASTGTTAITGYIDNLTVDTISSCNRPATVTADSVSAYGATLAWSDPSEAGTYMLRWSDGVNADSITLTGVTTYVLTNLVPSTTYTVDVRSICWGTPTNARSVSFTTLCAPMPLPWEMNFDNITNVSQLSSCWNRYSGRYNDTVATTLIGTTSGWTSSTTAFGGSSHLKVNIYGTNCKYWLVTPEIDLSEEATLTFDYMLTDYNNDDAPDTAVSGFADDRFVVLATTDGESWTPLAKWGSDTARDDYSLSTVTNTVSQASISLAAFTGQNVRLAFYGESTVSGTDNDLRIDNLLVSATVQDTTTPGDTTIVNPPDSEVFTMDSLRYWIGNGPDSAMFVVQFDEDEVALAWGILFDAEEDWITINDVLDTVAAHDSRFSYSASHHMSGYTMLNSIAYNDSTLHLSSDNHSVNSVQFNGEFVAGDEMEDYWLEENGDRIDISTGGYFSMTNIIAVLPPVAPADTTETPVDPVEDTLCSTVYALPYATDFSGYVDNQAIRPHMSGAVLPECWAVFNNGTLRYAYAPNGTTSTYFGGIGYSTSTNSFGAIAADDAFMALIGSQIYTGDDAEYIAAVNAVGTRRYAVLPLFDHPLSQTVLSFDHRTSGTGARLVVGYILADTSSFVGIDTMAADNRVLHHDTVRFNQHEDMPANARLAFLWDVTGSTSSMTGPGYRYCGIDNLSVTVAAVDTTTPVDTTVATPTDATIAFSDILYWVGSGTDSAVFIVNYAQPDTAFAWGYLFNGSTTAETMVGDISAADPRLEVSGSPSMGGDIRFALESGDTLGLSPVGELGYNFWWTNLNGVSADAGAGTTIHNGDVFKYGDLNSAIGWDLMGSYFMQEAWEKVPTPVSVPDTTSAPTDTTETFVEATIAASDILFWVGEGSNEVVMAVNWADTALAWGYRFDLHATVADMMNAIAEADPRFSYVGSGFISDILYIDTAAGMTDTLRITPGSYWSSTNNGVMDMGMGQPLSNGDFEKWADGSTGILVDSTWVEDYGGYWNYIYVYPMAIHPVTVPDTTSHEPVDPVGIGAVDADIVLTVWPNPATERIHVEVSDAVEARLFDLTGRLVGSYQFQQGTNIVDLSGLNEGVYMLRVNGITCKIVRKR